MNFTKKEKDEGAEFLFVEIEEALKLMKKSYDNLKASIYDDVYSTKFMVLRDIKILEYFMKNK